ncbi:hypothetical protein PQX77_021200 [Marasmius sp. AFHP31]|nr:hypothetical protein PQX77_021200 [Marasmius sp. AFHP31]
MSDRWPSVPWSRCGSAHHNGGKVAVLVNLATLLKPFLDLGPAHPTPSTGTTLQRLELRGHIYGSGLLNLVDFAQYGSILGHELPDGTSRGLSLETEAPTGNAVVHAFSDMHQALSSIVDWSRRFESSAGTIENLLVVDSLFKSLENHVKSMLVLSEGFEGIQSAIKVLQNDLQDIICKWGNVLEQRELRICERAVRISKTLDTDFCTGSVWQHKG